MYVGSGTAAETVETWFEANLARDHSSSQEPFLPPTRWPASVGVVLVVSAAAVLGLLLLAALRLLLEMRQAGRDGLTAPRLAALLVAGTVSAAAAAYLAAHFVGDGARATALERRGWVVVYRNPVAGVRVMARTSPG
jgi:hypothetical protein